MQSKNLTLTNSSLFNIFYIHPVEGKSHINILNFSNAILGLLLNFALIAFALKIFWRIKLSINEFVIIAFVFIFTFVITFIITTSFFGLMLGCWSCFIMLLSTILVLFF